MCWLCVVCFLRNSLCRSLLTQSSVLINIIFSHFVYLSLINARWLQPDGPTSTSVTPDPGHVSTCLGHATWEVRPEVGSTPGTQCRQWSPRGSRGGPPLGLPWSSHKGPVGFCWLYIDHCQCCGRNEHILVLPFKSFERVTQVHFSQHRREFQVLWRSNYNWTFCFVL